MKNPGKSAAVGVVLVLVVPACLLAQVAPTQDGRALDANYRIGGGRYNTIVRGVPGVNSQLYITGQVTGLAAFRGHTAYVGADQLRLTVPSASQSDFRGRSVGLPDVLRGNSYRTSAYYDRATTALGTRSIVAGLTAPGTNIPRSSLTAPLAPKRVYQDALADFRPLLGARPGRAISASISPVVPDAGWAAPRVIGRVPHAPPRIVAALPVSGRVAGIYAVPRPEDRQRLVSELYELDHGDRARLGGRVGEPTDNTRVVRPAPGSEGGQPYALGGLGIHQTRQADQDVFHDMLFLLQQQYQAAADQAAEARAAAEGATERQDDRFVVGGPGGAIVFKTLAGKGKDLFNEKLRAAEALMAAGRFYSAANEYRVAVIIDPENPLARLGLSVAMFAAGEPVSAAVQLRRAMELFPALMVTRLEAVRRIPSKTLRREIDKLYARVNVKASNVDPQLAMLSVYMHIAAGEKQRAQVSARKMLVAAGDDKFYKAYATFILTGKRPAARTPTTAPAAKK